MESGNPSDESVTANDLNSPEAIERRDKLARLIADVDARVPSPAVRALKVWEALNKEGITLWDLVCFCSESLGFLVPVFPDLLPGIRRVILDVHFKHYQNPEQLEQWETQIPDEIPASPNG